MANKVKNSIECWIYDRIQSSFLLLQCPETAKHKEYWQPVTGGIEAAETKFAACVREVKEETGITIDQDAVIKLIDKYSVYGETLNLHKTVFIVVIDEMPVKISDEHTGYRWVMPELVEQMLLWGSNKKTFGSVLKYLKLD